MNRSSTTRVPSAVIDAAAEGAQTWWNDFVGDTGDAPPGHWTEGRRSFIDFAKSGAIPAALTAVLNDPAASLALAHVLAAGHRLAQQPRDIAEVIVGNIDHYLTQLQMDGTATVRVRPGTDLTERVDAIRYLASELGIEDVRITWISERACEVQAIVDLTD